jgi:hypothetical protein
MTRERLTIYKVIFIGWLAASLSVSAAAHAQAPQAKPALPSATSPISTPPQPSADAPVVTITVGQLLAIGGGAIVGIIVLDELLPTRIAYAFGGLAGAYLGDMVYIQNAK